MTYFLIVASMTVTLTQEPRVACEAVASSRTVVQVQQIVPSLSAFVYYCGESPCSQQVNTPSAHLVHSCRHFPAKRHYVYRMECEDRPKDKLKCGEPTESEDRSEPERWEPVTEAKDQAQDFIASQSSFTFQDATLHISSSSQYIEWREP